MWTCPESLSLHFHAHLVHAEHGQVVRAAQRVVAEREQLVGAQPHAAHRPLPAGARRAAPVEQPVEPARLHAAVLELHPAAAVGGAGGEGALEPLDARAGRLGVGARGAVGEDGGEQRRVEAQVDVARQQLEVGGRREALARLERGLGVGSLRLGGEVRARERNAQGAAAGTAPRVVAVVAVEQVEAVEVALEAAMTED